MIDTDSFVFNFGKYKGKAYSGVFSFDPGYIYWCHHNVEWFKLSDCDFAKLREEIERWWTPNRGSSSRPYTCGDFGFDDDHGYGPAGNAFNLKFG